MRLEARRFGRELLVLRLGRELVIGLGVVDDAREQLRPSGASARSHNSRAVSPFFTKHHS